MYHCPLWSWRTEEKRVGLRKEGERRDRKVEQRRVCCCSSGHRRGPEPRPAVLGLSTPHTTTHTYCVHPPWERERGAEKVSSNLCCTV